MSTSATQRFLLDTHVWFWLVTGNRQQLKQSVVSKLVAGAEATPLLVSVISVWEIGMLVAKRRLALNTSIESWVDEAIHQPGLDVVGVSVQVALDSINLPGHFHADPADRFLIATARANRATLVTRDQRIAEYAKAGHVGVMIV